MALNKPEEAEGAYKNAMELDSKSDTYKELYTKARMGAHWFSINKLVKNEFASRKNEGKRK